MNKRTLLEKVAELVNDKKIDGISDLRDESDKSGMRVVIELKRGEVPEVVLNNLYKQTQLQDTFGMNMVALVDGQPRLLNLKQMLECFLSHRREVITRRTVFELRKARERAHIQEGLAVALDNVDEIIALIKACADAGGCPARPDGTAVDVADGGRDAGACRARCDAPGWPGHRIRSVEERLSAFRSAGASDSRTASAAPDRSRTGQDCHRLQELLERIADLMDILARARTHHARSSSKSLTAIRDAVWRQASFGDRACIRRISGIEDFITPQDMVVTLSHTGYIKSQPLADYRAQRRGGRGKQAAAVKEDDFVDHLFVANTHDFILCFSNRGRVYWLKVYEVPQGSRNSRGKPIVNMFPLEEGEKINAILPVKEFAEDRFIFMATSQGTVKKTPLSDFSNPRKAGIIAVALDEDDFLIGVEITNGDTATSCWFLMPARRSGLTRKMCVRWAVRRAVYAA